MHPDAATDVWRTEMLPTRLRSGRRPFTGAALPGHLVWHGASVRDFDGLTSIGKLRRLRRVAAEALRRYDLRDYRLALLADSFNTIFRVSCAGEIFVLRVGPALRIHTPDAAYAESAWTTELAAAGLRVPRIVTTSDGSPSVRAAADDVPGVRECTLLTWTTGRALTRPVSGRDVHDLAVLSARLHRASPARRSRPPGALNGRFGLLFELPNRLSELPEPRRSLFTAALARAQSGIDGLWQRRAEPPPLIHHDLAPNNVLRDRHGLRPIDFQDLTWGHREQDLANTIYGLTRGDLVNETIERFRSSYETLRPWPELNDDLLADLFAARRASMVNLALAVGRPGLDDYLARHSDALRTYLRSRG